jgi:hypothetical protein
MSAKATCSKDTKVACLAREGERALLRNKTGIKRRLKQKTRHYELQSEIDKNPKTDNGVKKYRERVRLRTIARETRTSSGTRLRYISDQKVPPKRNLVLER